MRYYLPNELIACMSLLAVMAHQWLKASRIGYLGPHWLIVSMHGDLVANAVGCHNTTLAQGATCRSLAVIPDTAHDLQSNVADRQKKWVSQYCRPLT